MSFKEPAAKKNSTWYKVLECIDEGLKIQDDIAKQIDRSQGRVSQIFEELREKRYIDENDKITEKGRKILDDHSGGDD